MSYRQTILAANPNTYWRFSEFSGNFTFDEISGIPLNYIILPGGVLTQQNPGLINDPNFSINLNNAYPRGISPRDYSQPGSLDLWFKTTNPGTGRATLFTNYRNDNDWSYRLFVLDLGGQIILEINTLQGLIQIPATGININDGQKYNVVITYDGITVIIYVNGLARGTATNITIIDSITDFFALGNEYFGDETTQYNGTIDEVSGYGYAKTLSQVENNYSVGINLPAPEIQGGVFASLINVQSLSVKTKL